MHIVRVEYTDKYSLLLHSQHYATVIYLEFTIRIESGNTEKFWYENNLEKS